MEIKNEKQLIQRMREKYPDFIKEKKGEINDWVEYRWTSDECVEKINFTTCKNVYDELNKKDNLVFFNKKELYKWFEKYVTELKDIETKFDIGDIVYCKEYNRYDIKGKIKKIKYRFGEVLYDIDDMINFREEDLILAFKNNNG